MKTFETFLREQYSNANELRLQINPDPSGAIKIAVVAPGVRPKNYSVQGNMVVEDSTFNDMFLDMD